MSSALRLLLDTLPTGLTWEPVKYDLPAGYLLVGFVVWGKQRTPVVVSEAEAKERGLAGAVAWKLRYAMKSLKLLEEFEALH